MVLESDLEVASTRVTVDVVVGGFGILVGCKPDVAHSRSIVPT
jgi:hypothetical protein